jgi:site-specific recombinase XerD
MTKPRTGAARTGPLARFADGFAAWLKELGYSDPATRSHLGLLHHLSRWLAAEGLDIDSLTPQVADRFLRARREDGYVTKRSLRGLRPLLRYLDEFGELPAAWVATTTDAELVLNSFRRYLLAERGLGTGTVGLYEGIARSFLAKRTERIRDDLAGLTGADISDFVVEQCATRSSASAKNVVFGLRALLQFLYVDGWIQHELSAAVPAVARRDRGLPRAIEVEQVGRILASCALDTPVGIRDFAILTMLTRLGVRAQEVARLALRDIDWRAGEVLVHGKGTRLERLPLPVDVGEAVADYVRQGRPYCTCPHLFVRSCAPLTGLSRQAISGIVRAACSRAGVPEVGPHRFRHTVATGLLRQGASLPEIGQLLRHRSLGTTAIYAKVDTESLSTLALAWPGAAV